jgi:8-oxo-dGTP pyrophosphatase MutT (NUDIX family)
MRETSASSEPSDQSTIRDAACVVLIGGSVSEPSLLMGRRHADQVFLPSKWVFPGGRVDADDRALAGSFAGTYAPPDLAQEIRPFALAALRELSEEAGLVIGNQADFAGAQNSGWQHFAASGYAPAPENLLPMARAITPPGRVRRYDTWFFTAPQSAVSGTPRRPDSELLDLSWFTLSEARKLDLPNITRLVLEDVALDLRNAMETERRSAAQVPFYYATACGFQRTLISCKLAPSAP